MSRCSICASPQVAAIDADLAGGASIRATARKFGVPRTTLARHAGHSAPVASEPAEVAVGDQLSAAVELLESASTERERLRGLEAVRQAIRLELTDYSRRRSALKAPTDEQRAELERNVRAAWAAYESAGTHGVRDRALSGVRSAVDAIRAADAAGSGDTMPATIFGHAVVVGVDLVGERLGIPKAYRSPEYGIRVTPAIGRPPLIEVGNESGVVWRRGLGDPPALAEVDPAEPPASGGNGNGNGNGHGG